MFYRILTKNGVDNTNIDGARNYNFNAGRRSGIVKGALNQGNFFASSSNTIALDTCELRLCGHRVVIDEAKSISFHNQPSVSIRYSLVAQIIVDNDGGVSFDLHAQTSSTALVQDNLDTNGSGTYELEIGRFTQLTDGTITDVVRTADLITGGAGGGDSEYIRIGTVTTNKISPELDADVDIENTINPDDNKPQTNFTFNLPTPSGTVVSVAGEEKTEINTDITPTANSQNLVTSGGVHDYPAVTFAESERQKSKNLFNINNGFYNGALTTSGEPATAANVSFSIDNETITLTTDTYAWRGIRSEYFKLKENTVYTLSYSRSDVVAFLVCFYDSSYTFISSVYEQGNTQKTFTVPTNTIYVRFGIQNTSVGTVTISNIQIEEGSIATSYQPYNGQITHNGDAPVVFAEDERQKSKNLCCLKNESATVAGVTMIYDSINQTIELNGTSTGDINIMPNIRNILPIISNSLGKTYSFTILKESGNFSKNFGAYLGSLDSDIWSDRFTLWVDKVNTSSSSTFTVSTNHTYDTLFVYLLKGTVVNNLKLKVQIEEGSVATDYQPYNGAIVHEKEIEITIGNATLNTDVVTAGEVSWVKQGKLVVVSFSDLKFKGSIAHQNLYFSGLPKKAIKSQTFLLHQMNAHGGSSLICMMQKDSTQIVNWYQDTTLDTNTQYYGQFTYITDEN